MENIKVVVETKKSRKTGNDYEAVTIVLPDGIEIPVYGLGRVEIQLIKKYSTHTTSFKE